MEKFFRKNNFIISHQYTQEFKNELLSNDNDEYDDSSYIVIPGMSDTEFLWNQSKQELKIVYSNYYNFYENVTPENYREPEIINVGDYIIKECGIYHIETTDEYNKKK